jgi:ppGpp synthetase/RelA/SpoT-type nucleotidyltranferase
MDVTTKILKEFSEKKKLLEDFKTKLNSLLSELLEAKSINPHQITCRVKDYDRLRGKIERKGNKYTCLADITDIVGLRIITYFEDDVDIIAEIIKKEFKIDEPNSVDKRKLETDRFGYQSLHYVIEMSDERVKLSENKKFNGLKAEVQIRSVLQHAWAEIEHDLGYKSEIEIPQAARRSFYRIAALLETADIEFVNLKKTLSEYKANISDRINESPESVLLDKVSLIKFIENNNLVKNTDMQLAHEWGVTVNSNNSEEIIEHILQRADFLSIGNIKDLEENLVRHSTEVVIFAKLLHTPKARLKNMPQGLSVIYLLTLLVAKKEDYMLTKFYVIKTSDHFEQASIKRLTDKITKVYQTIKKL